MPTGTIFFLDTNNSNAVLGTAALGGWQTAVSWLNPQSPATGSNPESIAVGDFNGDGIPDLAVANYGNSGDNSLTILLDNGDGTFTSSTMFPGQFYGPTSIAVGDFNGDGKQDLAVSSYGSVAILLGNGDGTFKLSTINLGGNTGLTFVAIGDFNGDGILDLAVANQGESFSTYSASSVTILLGKGDGTFTPAAASPATGSYPSSIAVGDLNGDGKADMAVTCQGSSTVTILLGNGDGTFTPAPTIQNAPVQPRSVVIADFNGDGIPDLAIGGDDYYGLILLGKGDGTFTQGASPIMNGASSIAAGDFSGDGKVDLATVWPDNNTVTVLLGKGDGTFTQGASPSTGNFPWAITSANLNGDGVADLVLTNASGNTVTVLTSQLTQTATASASGILATGPGLHQTDASYPGDNKFKSSLSATTGLTGGLVSTALSLRVTPSNGSTYAQQIVLTAILSPYNTQARSTNGETITFLNGSSIVGTGTLSSGVATLNLTSLPAAVANLTASYAGDTTFSSINSNVISYPVTKATPTITWPTPAAITYGTAIGGMQLNATASTGGTFTYTPASGLVLPAGPQTLSATFAPTDATNYSTPPTATVTLNVNKAPLAIGVNNAARVVGTANPIFTGTVAGAVNGDTFTESFSTAATAASIVGSYPIVPSVSGINLADYSVTPTNGALTISQAGTSTTFALSNSNLTLTANVVSLTSGTPTGSVGFYEGQTLVGTGTLTNGVATYTTASFPAGNVVVSAQYSGDANFTESESSPILMLSVTPAQTSITVSQAGSVTDALSLSVASGFSGTLQLSCMGLPQGATCSFQPSSITFTGTNNAANTTLTVQTGMSASAVASPLYPFNGHNLTALAGLFGLPSLALLGFTWKTRRLHPRILLLLMLACTCAGLTACGSTSPTLPQSPIGTSTVQVVASDSSGFSQTTSLNLTVQ